jgi:hypothetical protein
MLNFTKDQMKTYVEGLLPISEVISAKKVGNTIAVKGVPGQEVITYEVNKETGEEYIERTAKVEIDPETNEPGWILTKTGNDNQPVVNRFGHTNNYIVTDSKFNAMYEPSVDGPGLYSKKQIEMFIQSPEDITFETKYGQMVVPRGGYIKVSDLERISGISEESFLQTYQVIEPEAPGLKL